MIQKQLVLLALFLSAVLFHTRVESVALDTETITDDELNMEVAQPHYSIAEGDAQIKEDFMKLPPIPASCREIRRKNPFSASGLYPIKVGHKYINVYCNMGMLCNSNDGWTRIAYLDMDKSQSCPNGLHERKEGNVRACGRKIGTNVKGCASAYFSSLGIRYSQVCGRVYGYQHATPDGAYNGNQDRIDVAYIDGVSVTRGYPREHIWSFIGGVSELSSQYPILVCPCTQGSKQKIQNFINDNYFCESGNPDKNYAFKFYPNDKLWDGKNCNNNEAGCCKKSGRPWFHRKLSVSSDDIEVRVCGDQGAKDEDTPINYIEIYVK